MFNRILVPHDGSSRSFTALAIADQLAASCAADLEILQITDPTTRDREYFSSEGRVEVDELRAPSATLKVIPVGDTIGSTIADHYLAHEGTMIVMSSAGRGRSEAVLGSVAEEVLGLTFGPMIVVGPACERTWRAGGAPVVIPVDGSELSETALGIGVSWGIALGLQPWIVTVTKRAPITPPGVFDSAYPASLAVRMSRISHHRVEFEALHSGSPAAAIVDFATENHAGLIVVSTHGRTGMHRLAMGSVAAAIVRHAPCPVVLSRPPHMTSPQMRREERSAKPSASAT
jgi:nucleotide-binding universal stress UspA family protein